MIKWLCAMMFATTAFMAAAQAQSSYTYPCADYVRKHVIPELFARGVCNNCGDCAEYNHITASPGPSPRAQSAPRRGDPTRNPTAPPRK
jgi:hypothetical protein